MRFSSMLLSCHGVRGPCKSVSLALPKQAAQPPPSAPAGQRGAKGIRAQLAEKSTFVPK
jgi:hypothetical protein